MPDAIPRFQQVNLVVRDMDAVLAFYRTLGLPIRGGEGEDWPPGSGGRHAEVETGDEQTVELDNVPGVKLWHSGWRETGRGVTRSSCSSLPNAEPAHIDSPSP